MRPILAILHDSYRELSARRIFWLVLAISAAIVLGYGSIGFNAEGMSIGYGLYTFKTAQLAAGSPLIVPFMDFIFSQFILKVWLAWGAVILALISTASVFPDFLSGGSIDLVLSKPVRRSTIFLTKYLGSLMFVFLQSLIFCGGIFLVTGLRLDAWRWPMFWAVPIVLLVFSYLYCIMVLANVVTRSVLASLLLTALAWLAIFVTQSAHSVVSTELIRMQVGIVVNGEQVAWYDGHIPKLEAQALELESRGESEKAAELRGRIAEVRSERQREIDEIAEKTKSVTTWEPWQSRFALAANLLPKTGESVEVVRRRLEKDSALSQLQMLTALFDSRPDTPPDPESDRPPRSRTDTLVQERTEVYFAARTPFFVFSTSLIFEVLVLGLATLIFVRTDF